MKKKYLCLCTVILTLLIFSITFAENFKGPYTGIALGVNNFHTRYRQSKSGNGNALAITSNTSALLFNYGLFGGYGQTIGQYYIGGEIGLSMTNGETKFSALDATGAAQPSSTTKENYVINPIVRCGILLTSDILAFLKFGFASAQMRVNAIPIDGGPTTKFKKTFWGYSLGTGVETFITKTLSLRGDYTLNIYQTKQFNIVTTPPRQESGKITPRDSIFRLGIAYHF